MTTPSDPPAAAYEQAKKTKRDMDEAEATYKEAKRANEKAWDNYRDAQAAWAATYRKAKRDKEETATTPDNADAKAAWAAWAAALPEDNGTSTTVQIQGGGAVTATQIESPCPCGQQSDDKPHTMVAFHDQPPYRLVYQVPLDSETTGVRGLLEIDGGLVYQVPSSPRPPRRGET